MSGAQALPQGEVSETDPLRLKVAVAIAFPHGGMTVSGLRREHKKGNLAFEIIAGKRLPTISAPAVRVVAETKIMGNIVTAA